MCFVPVHVRPMVPRDRSPAALGGVGTVSQILLMLSISRVGTGLNKAVIFVVRMWLCRGLLTAAESKDSQSH